MEFTITCELPLSAQDMWRIRASAGFRRHVVEDGLLKKLDCTSPTRDKDGYWKRTQRYIPTKVDCPNFLRSIIGDTLFDVTDEQRWNDETEPLHQRFSIRPTHLSSFCITTGSLTLTPMPTHSTTTPSLSDDTDLDNVSSDEEDDDVIDEEHDAPDVSPFATLPLCDRSLHTIAGTTKVNLPGAGWAVERSIIHNLRVFYSMYPATVSNFRKKLYDKFANGDQNVPTSVVVDRFLKHEEETESVSDDLSDGDADVTVTHGNSLDLGNMPPFEAPQKGGGAGCSIEEELEKFFVSV